MKVSIRKSNQEFQVDIEPRQTVVDLKAEISKIKGYPIDTQRLIHSGSPLPDDKIIKTLGFKSEKDYLILTITNGKSADVKSTGPSTASKVAEHSLPTLSLASLASTESGKGPQINSPPLPLETVTTKPIPRFQVPSQVAGPSSLNFNQISSGTSDGELGTVGNMGSFASMGQLHEDPTFRQMLFSSIAEKDPAMAKKLEEDPGLFDSVMQMASAQAEQGTMLVGEDKEAIKRLVDMGFTEKQAMEAYFVSDKDEAVAVDYLVKIAEGSDADDLAPGVKPQETPSFANFLSQAQDPSFRQRFTEVIEQQDPALGQAIRKNPHLLDLCLQKAALEAGVETTEEREAIQYLVDLGFTHEQAMEAYFISDKDTELAVGYLVTAHSNDQIEKDDSADVHQASKTGQAPACAPEGSSILAEAFSVEGETSQPNTSEAILSEQTNAEEHKEVTEQQAIKMPRGEDQEYTTGNPEATEAISETGLGNENPVVNSPPIMSEFSSSSQLDSEPPKYTSSPPSERAGPGPIRPMALSQGSLAFLMLLGAMFFFLSPFVGLVIAVIVVAGIYA